MPKLKQIAIGIPPFVVTVELSENDLSVLPEFIRKLLAPQRFAGCYRIICKHSGKCLDVKDYSLEDGAKVFQYTWHGGHNQQWWLIRNQEGYYHIINRQSGKCLDVPGASQADGVMIHQYHFNSHPAQQWDLKEAEKGYYFIIARHSGKALDDANYGTEDCTDVIQYALHGNDNQRWRVEPVK